jgi:hypothetical protein
MRVQTIFEVRSDNMLTFNYLSVLIFNWKWRDTSPTNFDARQTNRNCPESFEIVRNSWSDLSLRALIQAEVISSSRREMFSTIITQQLLNLEREF